VTAALAAVVVLLADGTWGLPATRQLPVDATVGVTFSVMAAVVLTSRSLRAGSRALAWTLMTAGVCSGAAALSTALAAGATGDSALAGLAVQVQGCIWVPGFVPLLTLVPLFYPDGLLPGRTWRLASYASVLGIALLTVGVGLYPEPFHGRTTLEKPWTDLAAAQVLVPVAAVLLVPATLVATTSLVLRLRRSRGLARRQVVVLLWAAAVLILTTAAQGVLPTPADVVAQACAAGLLAVAIGVAVTRHGLYDLDTAVARALVAASLAVCLAGAYLTLFTLLESLLRDRSALSAALAAGLTGAVIQPLARRLRTGVDRMYYGDRAEPFTVTSSLAARLTATGLDVAEVPQVVCDTVVEALRLPGARVRLALDGGPGPVASSGTTDASPVATFAMVHRGEVVAELDVWPRAGERVLHGRDDVVLRGLADQVAPAVAALRLHQQLQRGREDLVAARESQRLQLRRDLHDGLGATLAGLRLQIETARDLSDEPGVTRLLGSAGDGVAQAVAEVRAITDGLRPAALDDLGLAGALAALAERVRAPGLEVEVDLAPDVTADPAVEVALHRIAAEALANVVRHAGASRVSLQVRDGQRLVELVVADDGAGLAGADARSAGSGLGLASMRQRAEEVGGTLEVSSTPAGTTVHALLPHAVGGLR
jgi:signal transduction histidine kinase